MRDFAKRVLVRLVLVAAVVPVIVLGPALVRAPATLLRKLAVREPLQAAQVAGAAHGSHGARGSHGAHGVRGPGRVRGLRLIRRRGAAARVGWKRASHGRYPIEGYRVWRDGAVVGQTPHTSFVLRLSSSRAHRILVRAVDNRGHLGPASRVLKLAAHAPSGSRPGGARRPAAGQDAPSAPGSLSVSDVADQAATLWWVPSRAGSARIVGYRVYRDGRLLTQVAKATLRMRGLSSSRTYVLSVSAIDAAHRESARSAPLRLSTSHTPPIAPPLISASSVTDSAATLSWQAGAVNSGRLVGYLLFKDGLPVRVVQGQIATVALASQRRYTLTVRTLDSFGYLSAPAPEVAVLTTHTPPSTPAGLSASQVTDTSAGVAWSPSRPVSGRIVGYRVFRNEIPVGQPEATSTTLASLAPSSDYRVTVAAVDSLGAISAPSAPLLIHTADPTPTHGNVQAFLLATTDQSFEDLQAHYQQIGIVYPTNFDCAADASITGQDDPLVTGWARARQIAVMPRLNCQRPNVETQILTDPATRAATIERLASLCQTYDYQGIQLDFEGAPPTDRNPFTVFVTELAARLHAQGDRLSTVVTAKSSNVMTGRAAMYDDAALSVPSDYVFVLDWGLHWSTSVAGPMDELPWFTKIANYTATMLNKGKFVLGMPLYGIDWPNGGGPGNPGTPLEFTNVMSLMGQYGALRQWDPTAQNPYFTYTDANGVPHSVWYSDRQSVQARVEVASALGLGVGLWHLGSEDQSVWGIPGLGGG